METSTTVVDEAEAIEEAARAAVSPDAGDPAAPIDLSRFTVPLTIAIEEAVVPVERLQALRTGAVVPIAAEDGTIPVRILASGRPIARGTLISVGDGYGVLIGDDSLEG